MCESCVFKGLYLRQAAVYNDYGSISFHVITGDGGTGGDDLQRYVPMPEILVVREYKG